MKKLFSSSLYTTNHLRDLIAVRYNIALSNEGFKKLQEKESLQLQFEDFANETSAQNFLIAYARHIVPKQINEFKQTVINIKEDLNARDIDEAEMVIISKNLDEKVENFKKLKENIVVILKNDVKARTELEENEELFQSIQELGDVMKETQDVIDAKIKETNSLAK